MTHKNRKFLNIFHELRGFYDDPETATMSPTSRYLWHVLLFQANLAMWQEDFPLAIPTLEHLTGLNKQAIQRGRSQLKAKGYIDYKSGRGNQCARYTMISHARQYPPVAGSDPRSDMQCDPHTDTHAAPLRDTLRDTQCDTQREPIYNKYNKIIYNDTVTESMPAGVDAENAPSVEEVREYCLERGNGIDPERFVDYYTAAGWSMGKRPIKDWRAAVRVWESREKGCGERASQQFEASSFDTDDFFEAAIAHSLRQMEAGE